MRMNREKTDNAFQSNDAFYLHEQAWSGSSFPVNLTFQAMGHAPFSQLWPALIRSTLAGGRVGEARLAEGQCGRHSIMLPGHPPPPARQNPKAAENLGRRRDAG